MILCFGVWGYPDGNEVLSGGKIDGRRVPTFSLYCWYFRVVTQSVVNGLHFSTPPSVIESKI